MNGDLPIRRNNEKIRIHIIYVYETTIKRLDLSVQIVSTYRRLDKISEDLTDICQKFLARCDIRSVVHCYDFKCTLVESDLDRFRFGFQLLSSDKNKQINSMQLQIKIT